MLMWWLWSNALNCCLCYHRDRKRLSCISLALCFFLRAHGERVVDEGEENVEKDKQEKN